MENFNLALYVFSFHLKQQHTSHIPIASKLQWGIGSSLSVILTPPFSSQVFGLALPALRHSPLLCPIETHARLQFHISFPEIMNTISSNINKDSNMKIIFFLDINGFFNYSIFDSCFKIDSKS